MRWVTVAGVSILLLLVPATVVSEPSDGRYAFRVPYVSTLNVETVTPPVPCVASWYGGGEPLNEFTASGVPFDAEALAVAAWDYPFGTVLEVSGNGRSVRVTVNDRGPARRLGRCLDLTKAAYSVLDSLDSGLLEVTYTVISEGE